MGVLHTKLLSVYEGALTMKADLIAFQEALDVISKISTDSAESAKTMKLIAEQALKRGRYK